MKCQQIKCDQSGTHKVFWPGSPPLLACKDHAIVAEKIAGSMGLYIHIEEVLYSTNEDGEAIN